MGQDDAAYRQSVKNTIIVIAVIVVIIAAVLFIPPVVSPVHEQFNSTTSVASPYGLSLDLKLNGTRLAAGRGETITAWLNGTSSQVANISAADGWPLGPEGLWTRICTSGWPLGVGFMAGYYTSDNYSLGSLVLVPVPLLPCPEQIIPPAHSFFSPTAQQP